MYTQTKKFTLKLIEDLVNNDSMINIHSNHTNSYPVEKYINNIEQEMIYAIEYHDTIHIVKNDVIHTLLLQLETLRKNNSVLAYRKLSNYRISICLLDYKSTDEEKKLFKQLVSSK